MKKTVGMLLFALCAWSAGAMAQAQQAPKEQANCAVSLPYADGAFPDCTPRTAAAYDFAFCSFFYHVVSLSAPASDKSLGEKGQGATYRRKATDFAMISAALSSAETLQKNIALAQKYYETLNGGDTTYIRLTIDTIRLKCEGADDHHSETLDELSRSMRRARPGS